ncbi:MAG TPA: type II secretion system protein GspN, partial [Dissulfurispiraceae bacterium]
SELLFSVDNLSGRINPFSLFLIRLPLTFEGEAGGGRFSGRVELLRGKGETDIKVDGMSMEKVPFFEEIGMGGSGTLAGTLKMLGGTGSMKFSIKDLRFDSGTLFGIPIAPDMFRIARAALTIQGGVLRIDSFSLEGSGVYARIKGNIAGGKPDLTLEIMSDSPAADLAPSLALLDNYRISPGYYVIPVKELPTAK